MPDLANQHCVPCKGGIPPLATEAIDALLPQLDPAWKLVDAHHLARTLHFPDFASGLNIVNQIGVLAEQEGHHPDLLLAWGRVEITLWTHKVDGLTESDFVLAAKIDRLLS